MAKYGVDYYNVSYYGATTLVDFSAAPVLAVPHDYKNIYLTWTTPTGGWDYLRLVRNLYGFPVTGDDGDILFEDAKAVSRATYTDTGTVPNNIGLREGHAYYYAIYVRETVHSTWQKAGVAIGISVKDYNTASRMYDSLPKVLTSQVPQDSSVSQDNDVLARFLKIFALNLDLYKTQAENVLNRYVIPDVHGALIPAFMQQFGLTYEPELGLWQSRILLQNAAHLYAYKGSKLGIKDYVKAYAGYDNVITNGKNLMLDQNDSSFEQSIGSWVSYSNATLARHSLTDSPTIAPYFEVLSQASFPNLQNATLQVTAVATAAVEISLGGDTPIHYGIPVTAASAYTFTAYARAGVTARANNAQLYWYDRTGALLSSSTAGSTATTSTSAWTRVTTTATAPTGAYFCVPHLHIAATVSSEVHYFDALQFEQAASATFFKDARQISIVLKGTRVNELTNPNFEGSTTGWTGTNSTLILSTVEDASVPDVGAVSISGGSIEVYATTSASTEITSDFTSVLPSNNYTFSAYVKTENLSNPTHSVTLRIAWYNGATFLSNSDSTPSSVTSTWSRLSVTGVSPATATGAYVSVMWTAVNTSVSITGITAAGGVVSYATADTTGLFAGQEITVSGASTTAYNGFWTILAVTANTKFTVTSASTGATSTATGLVKDEISVDAALFEKSAFLNSYFDGSNGVAALTDLFWEGTANLSRSHYYKNRFSVQSRLISTIPNWINLGSTFELWFAQAGV